MMAIPLAFDPTKWGFDQGQSTLSTIIDGGMSMMGGLMGTGAAIASIFILLVIVKCMIVILDGGKFSVKMLGPVVIYILVCNFGLVATPVRAFFGALQGAVVGQLGQANAALYVDENGNEMTKIGKILDAYKKNNAAAIEDLENKLKEEEKNKKPTEIDVTEEGGEGTDKPHKKFLGIDFTEIGDRIKRSILSSWDDIKVNFSKAFVQYEIHERKDFRSTVLAVGVTFILATFLDWFTGLLAIVMTSMGGILMGVAIVFGPISWAFAVIPGNGNVIKSWFIRICQFALYGPLCQLVTYFSSKIFLALVGSGSTIGLIGALLANIVMLTAIPQIASSIIEGASGGLSLSNGVQTLMSPYRLWNEINSIGKEPLRDKQQMSLGQQQLNTLKEISGKLGGAGGNVAGGVGSQGGGPTGQNPMS